jgi:hypothetical protein
MSDGEKNEVEREADETRLTTHVFDDRLRNYMENVGDEGMTRTDIDEDTSLVLVALAERPGSREEILDVGEKVEEKLSEVFETDENDDRERPVLVAGLMGGPGSLYTLFLPENEG